MYDLTGIFGSFFEQYYLLNLIILGVYAIIEIIEMCMYFRTETDLAQNLIDIFFLILTVRRPFHGKDFGPRILHEKRYGGTRLIYKRKFVSRI